MNVLCTIIVVSLVISSYNNENMFKVRVSEKMFVKNEMFALFKKTIRGTSTARSGNSRAMCEICSKSTIKTPERRQ